MGRARDCMAYLAPVIPPAFNIVSVILIVVASLAPVPILHNLSLLRVSQNQSNVDGPTVWMGLFGSCARSNKSAPIICTKAGLSPQYNLSSLPANSSSLLNPPHAFLTVLTFGAIFLGFLFFVSVCLMSIRLESDAVRSVVERPLVLNVILGNAFLSCILGVAFFLLLLKSFSSACGTFNDKREDSLKAYLGNGFKVIWVGYGLLALPLYETLVDYRESWKNIHKPAPEAKRDLES